MSAPITQEYFAALIPREYRQKLLNENIIYKAAALPQDPHMRVLFVVWSNYIDDNPGKMDCVFCLQNILSNFKEMQDILIQLEKDAALLDL